MKLQNICATELNIVYHHSNQYVGCEARLLVKKFGCEGRLFFKQFGCEARLLFKHWVQTYHNVSCTGTLYARKTFCQVVFEIKGFAREMASNCNVGATTYTFCWMGTDRGAARLTIERSFSRSP